MKLQTVLSSVLIGVGGGLMVLKIVEDSEPGAIPLLLILSGVLWKIVERIRVHRRKKRATAREQRPGSGA